MNLDLAPGKGLRVPLTKGTASELAVAMAELSTAHSLMSARSETDLVAVLLKDYNWYSVTEDKFGRKALKCTELANGGEIRITVVQKDDEIKIDIREWWQPEPDHCGHH